MNMSQSPFSSPLQSTFLWYDFETFGANARSDRACQFAGIRTDHQLNIIGEPIELFCQNTMDYIPNPMAVEVTGITPQHAEKMGVNEFEFARQLKTIFTQAQTCAVGYNSIRFDDEVVRHLFFRNLIDPYEREWKNGNSRWDLLDVARLTYALRPGGIKWPIKESGDSAGDPDFRLEAISKANNLGQGAAHDALNDVYATINLAKLINTQQPKLWQWAFALRSKQRVKELIDVRAHKPLIHISGMFGAKNGCLSVVVPLFEHPHNQNEIICFDCSQDPSLWLNVSADDIKERLYRRKDELNGEIRPALKSIHINKSPMIAPISMLDEEVCQRLHLDRAVFVQNWCALVEIKENLMPNFKQIFVHKREFDKQDVEQTLYDAFINNADKKICAQIHDKFSNNPAQWRELESAFVDTRLSELTFRLRARHYPETLSESERDQWRTSVKHRIQFESEKNINKGYTLEQAKYESYVITSMEKRELFERWLEKVSTYIAVL
jgi:exodeoxyribonuclease I